MNERMNEDNVTFKDTTHVFQINKIEKQEKKNKININTTLILHINLNGNVI